MIQYLISCLSADFTLLFLHTTHDSIKDQEWRAVLVKSLLTSDSSAVVVRRAIRLILHRLTPSTLPESAVGSYLSLLSEVIEGLRSCGKVSDAAGLVSFTLDSDVIKSLCSRSLNSKAREGASTMRSGSASSR